MSGLYGDIEHKIDRMNDRQRQDISEIRACLYEILDQIREIKSCVKKEDDNGE